MTESTSSETSREGSPLEPDLVTARLLAAGDPDGLQRLLASHGERVRETLCREFDAVLDASEIEDAVSQASQRVWRSRQMVDLGRGTLRAWFYVISRNCALRILEVKRGPRGLRLVNDLDARIAKEEEDPAAPVQCPEREKFASDLYACIDRLPRQQRAVVLADLAAGGTAKTEDLMKELETSANVIYVSRTTARKTLREALIKLGYAERESADRAGAGRRV